MRQPLRGRTTPRRGRAQSGWASRRRYRRPLATQRVRLLRAGPSRSEIRGRAVAAPGAPEAVAVGQTSHMPIAQMQLCAARSSFRGRAARPFHGPSPSASISVCRAPCSRRTRHGRDASCAKRRRPSRNARAPAEARRRAIPDSRRAASRDRSHRAAPRRRAARRRRAPRPRRASFAPDADRRRKTPRRARRRCASPAAAGRAPTRRLEPTLGSLCDRQNVHMRFNEGRQRVEPRVEPFGLARLHQTQMALRERRPPHRGAGRRTTADAQRLDRLSGQPAMTLAADAIERRRRRASRARHGRQDRERSPPPSAPDPRRHARAGPASRARRAISALAPVPAAPPGRAVEEPHRAFGDDDVRALARPRGEARRSVRSSIAQESRLRLVAPGRRRVKGRVDIVRPAFDRRRRASRAAPARASGRAPASSCRSRSARRRSAGRARSHLRRSDESADHSPRRKARSRGNPPPRAPARRE